MIVSDAWTINAIAVALALAWVVNGALRVTLQIVMSLTDNSRVVIYNCNMCKVQATGHQVRDISMNIHT